MLMLMPIQNRLEHMLIAPPFFVLYICVHGCHSSIVQ
jgi:hypothetical protein